MIHEMIKTQYIKSTTQRPTDEKGFVTVNVLKWNNSKWKTLCPYYLRTDGQELQQNDGNVLFENFYQGSKVFKKLKPQEQYASRFHRDAKYLWFKSDMSDALVRPAGQVLDTQTYMRWRDSVWSCQHPIRYPNGRAQKPEFTLLIDSSGQEHRLDYLEARRQVYFREYCRLVRGTKEYKELLGLLIAGKNLMICEMDVPAAGKGGLYGKCCSGSVSDTLSLAILEGLLDDPSEAFGHGLCLAYALLEDL
jgi:hypothetical protein